MCRVFAGLEGCSARSQPGLCSRGGAGGAAAGLPGQLAAPEIAALGKRNPRTASAARVTGDLLCWDCRGVTWGESSAAGTPVGHHGGHWRTPWLGVKASLPPWPWECRDKRGQTQLVGG